MVKILSKEEQRNMRKKKELSYYVWLIIISVFGVALVAVTWVSLFKMIPPNDPTFNSNASADKLCSAIGWEGGGFVEDGKLLVCGSRELGPKMFTPTEYDGMLLWMESRK